MTYQFSKLVLLGVGSRSAILGWSVVTSEAFN